MSKELILVTRGRCEGCGTKSRRDVDDVTCTKVCRNWLKKFRISKRLALMTSSSTADNSSESEAVKSKDIDDVISS